MVMAKTSQARLTTVWKPRISRTKFGWSVDWWERSKHRQRRFKSEEGAEAFAKELQEERSAREAGEKAQRKIVRANVRRGDVVVDLLNLPPGDKVAIAEALETLRAAGGSPGDLPAAAREFAEKHLSEYRATLGEVTEKHLEDLRNAGRSNETIRDRRWRLGKLVESMGAGRRVSTIGRPDIAEWVGKQTAGSRRQFYTAAAALFRWAWQRGYVSEYPMGALPKPPDRRRGEAKILTPEEVRKLLASAKKEGMELYVAVGVFAGLRPQSEMPWLDWGDVDFADGKLFVTSRKTGRTRPVPISGNLRAWLQEVPKGRRKGRVAAFSRRAWRRVQADAGVEVGHDVLRHTRCSYRLAELRDPGIVAAEGGHSLPVLQRHYANLRLKDAAVRRFWGIRPKGQGACRKQNT